jgi:CcmD family protein
MIKSTVVKSLQVLLLMMIAMPIMAQSNGLENTFFESGKIKVVMGVAVIIFIGIAIYLFRLDKKISKLEKEIHDEKN